jgi:guanosine-3',5'-bis(diphosphate) 3'-pyrophosphohydrolase
MNPGPTAKVAAAPTAAVPDYVLQLERAAHYLPPEQLPLLRRAWEVGASAHAGQTRKSGEPYITHPVAVAQVLAELGLDVEALIAAILHDTIEDTPLTREALAAEFGEAVAELVDGVTKLDKLKFRDRQEAAAESFRKMLLAMSRDLRVIMIKLADRLHNMRTLGAQSREARGRIARETLEIYAPIAQRLGMSLVKSELQNLGFKALYPWRHAIIEKHIRSQPVVRREAMAQVEVQLSQRLAKEGIEHRLISRIKTPWSIYNKMRDENKSFDQVMDVFGFRLVVRSVPSCYHALGSVHATFKPLDGRFRDFIAIPKANGYQSLHTVLFGPYGSPIEVQIRTEEMDLIAERGVAAHWTYKFGGDSPNSAQSRVTWIVELIDSQRAAGSSLEFLDNVKVDLFPDEVYLFTPKGKILALPRNSTARFRLRRAYRRRQHGGGLARGQETRAAAQAGVRRRWRSSPHARPRRNRSGWNSWSPARRAPPSATSSSSWSTRMPCSWATACSTVRWRRWIRRWSGCRRAPGCVPGRTPFPAPGGALLARSPGQLDADPGGAGADGLRRAARRPHSRHHSQEKILINGSERGVVTFAGCCQPIPGDEIMGYHTAGKGIVVHRMDCPNLAELRKSPERWVPIGWDTTVSGDYDTSLVVEVENGTGVLAQLAAAIAQVTPTSSAWTTWTVTSTPPCWRSTSRCATATTWPK